MSAWVYSHYIWHYTYRYGMHFCYTDFTLLCHIMITVWPNSWKLFIIADFMEQHTIHTGLHRAEQVVWQTPDMNNLIQYQDIILSSIYIVIIYDGINSFATLVPIPEVTSIHMYWHLMIMYNLTIVNYNTCVSMTIPIIELYFTFTTSHITPTSMVCTLITCLLVAQP